MNRRQLLLRSLAYYWRTHLAVALGVAVAVAVLAGALIVGDSVRGTLRALAVSRLGQADHVILSASFFREALGDDIRRDPVFASRFGGLSPLIAVDGVVTLQASGRRAGRVAVYGVDDRFWKFHAIGGVSGPADRDAFVSSALARDLAVVLGEAVLVRVAKPSAMPLESLFADKDDLGRTLRLTTRAILPAEALGEFSLDPRQGDIRAVFVPIARLQNELALGRRINALLVSAKEESSPESTIDTAALVQRHVSLDDLGLSVRVLDGRSMLAVDAAAGLLTDDVASRVMDTVGRADMRARPVFTYLANTIRANGREVPYSLVTATDLTTILPSSSSVTGAPPIVLNDWAAGDLGAKIGDLVALEFFVWQEPGRLVAKTSEFRLAGVVPVLAADRDFAPTYPGITDSTTIGSWDPPFPLDLRRVRPRDEAYWDTYRTTPKAYIPLEEGQRLWRSRYGALTSIRAIPPAGESPERVAAAYAERLRGGLDPLARGFSVRDVREEAITASRGATDFGQYFVYFSFFLVVSALVLVSLFFKLSIEQRAREVGLLRAVGFNAAAVRRLFSVEVLLLLVVAAVIGGLGAIGYAALVVIGLRTWWIDAVGTSALSLHMSFVSLAAGAVGGVAAALACTWWTLRGLSRISERSLLAGQLATDVPLSIGEARHGRFLVAAGAGTAAAVGLIGLASAGSIARAGGFFGAGALLLTSGLCLCAFLYRMPSRQVARGHGWLAMSRLGLRSAAYRPGRSVLSMGVIAAAVFILIAVEAFRRGETRDTDRQSGVGGYTLIAEALLPIVRDLGTDEGRRALNLSGLGSSTVEPFRVRAGDDVSCLNLYSPRNPRVVGVRDSFVAEGRFRFRGSVATTDADRANPWRLLARVEPDGAIPVIADANSMTYVLHRALGEDIVLNRPGGSVRLRLVAALDDTIFQGELLMAERQFARLFPEEEGYKLLLIETPATQVAVVQTEIETALVDLGVDATRASDRLAAFHRVENTYLSTFQALGGLGLVLGTLGLSAVLMRNVIERRRELALLGAVGYRRGHVVTMLMAESASLLAGGLVVGSVSAALAIVPVLESRGGWVALPGRFVPLAVLVVLTGMVSTFLAARAATRGSLLDALRSE